MQATIGRLRERREELNGDSGFTLIELLIVIVILGILAAIVVFAVQNLSGTSAKASCQSDVQTVDHAMQAYAAENAGKFPSNVQGLITAGVLHTNPTNTGHYAIEETGATTGTGVSTDPYKTGGTAATPAGTLVVLSNASGTGWLASTAYDPTVANGTGAACTNVS